MTTTPQLVIVTAGLSKPSSSRLLADRLTEATRRHLAEDSRTAEPRVIELRELATDIAGNLVTGFPGPALRDAIEAVEHADGVIAVTPVFAASYSGLFKSFFDVVGADVLDDKPVLIAATGGTARHSLALEHALRPMFAYLHAVTVPTSVFAAGEDWGGDEAEGQLRGRIQRSAGELAREIGRREPAVVDDPFALTTSFEDLLAGL
jgi:FMN reductase